jgi:hypothetical protein
MALGAGRPARAGTSDIVTRVVCPALPADARAEFEARAQVDLTLRSVGGGELAAACEGLAARVTWRPKTGGSFERSVSAGTPAGLVDALLVAVAELAEEASPQGQDENAETKAAGETPKRPKNSEAFSSSSPQEVDGSRDASRDVGKGWSIPIGASLGGTLMSNGIGGSGGLLGGTAGLLIGLPARLTLTAAGGYGSGFGAGSRVSVQEVEGMALVSAFLGPRRAFEIGAGVAGGTIMSSAPPSLIALDSSQSRAFFAAIARARYGWSDGAWRLAVGPELRIHVPPTSVEINKQAVWQVPVFTVGLTIDVATAFYGSLW